MIQRMKRQHFETCMAGVDSFKPHLAENLPDLHNKHNSSARAASAQRKARKAVTMEKSFDDMSFDEKVVYLVNGLDTYLWIISVEARKALRASGFTPEKAKEFKLLEVIEGKSLGQHEQVGAMDLVDHLRSILANDYGVEGLYEEEEEEDEESDELESVEA